MPENMEVFLRPTPIIESEHPEVVAFAKKHAAETRGAIETADFEREVESETSKRS